MRFKVHKNVMLLLLLCVSLICQSWGFWAHKRINRIAVYTLPPQMLGFYKSYIEYVTEHSVDADKRRHNNKEEAPRHYIDLEFYGNFDSIPKTWKAAVTKYSEDSLYSWGIVHGTFNLHITVWLKLLKKIMLNGF